MKTTILVAGAVAFALSAGPTLAQPQTAVPSGMPQPIPYTDLGGYSTSGPPQPIPYTDLAKYEKLMATQKAAPHKKVRTKGARKSHARRGHASARAPNRKPPMGGPGPVVRPGMEPRPTAPTSPPR